MNSLRLAELILKQAWQRLVQRWRETNSLWTDRVWQRFTKLYWMRLAAETSATLRAMEDLGDVLHAARRHVK